MPNNFYQPNFAQNPSAQTMSPHRASRNGSGVYHAHPKISTEFNADDDQQDTYLEGCSRRPSGNTNGRRKDMQ